MGTNTAIEWCDHTFNPWIGCTKVSPACDHCYAETQAARFKMAEWGQHAPRKRTSLDYWKQPLKWDRQASVRRKVFCASMADVFDNHRSIDPQWRLDLWQLIRKTQNLDWLFLTKRPQNIRKMLPPDWGNGWPNVWLGTTVENQEEAERRIPHLLDVPAAMRFLSCEPLLGPVRLDSINTLKYPGAERLDALSGFAYGMFDDIASENLPSIHWVIAGGESGSNARPSHPDWFRDLRDQCAAADVPFFFKQWGEWAPGFHDERPDVVRKVGKKRAGRMLAGRVHDQFPASEQQKGDR